MENYDGDTMRMLRYINKMIGSQGECPVGRHGATIEMLIFAKKIKEDKEMQDSFGKALQLCAPFLLSMSERCLHNFFALISFSEIPVETYGESFLQESGISSHWQFDDEELLNVAITLRHLGKYKYLSKERILQEKKIREKYPWYWIDVMEEYSFDEVLKVIMRIVKKEWKQGHIGKDTFGEISSNIDLWGYANSLRLVKQISPFISKEELDELNEGLDFVKGIEENRTKEE